MVKLFCLMELVILRIICVHDSDDNCVVGDNVSGDIDYVPCSDNVSEECDVTGVKRSKRNCRVPKQFRDFHLY